ncbi:MAG TPA: SRPBCC family protein [Xanthomonadaceae bacterium]|nr:SRPBCC family protein [Xanthomonadaceae bacterium]
MIRLLEFVIALVIVAVVFLVVGLVLPSHRHVEHSIETNHPIRQVYDTVSGFERFPEWHPMRATDPDVEYRIPGSPRGEGAVLEFESADRRLGSGTWEIVEAVEDTEVVFELQDTAYGTGKTHRIEVEERGKTVVITWSYDVEYGWNLFGRYAGLYINRHVGDTIKSGLNNVAGLIATMPNFDYSQLVVTKELLQPQHIVYSSKTADRNITAVAGKMDEGLAQVRRAIESNGLEAAGPPRLITTNFGDEKYDFDIALPVRVAGPGDEEGDEEDFDEELDRLEDDDELDRWAAAENGAEVSEVMSDPDACKGKLEAPEPLAREPATAADVKFGQSYGGCAVKARYVGHPAALPLVRDMLRSYAASHGLQIHDRAFEEYLTPMDVERSGTDAGFNVYWPVRQR